MLLQCIRNQKRSKQTNKQTDRTGPLKTILKSMTQHVLVLLYASLSGNHRGRRDISGTSFRHGCWPEKEFNEITGGLYCLSLSPIPDPNTVLCVSHWNWSLHVLISLSINFSQAQVAKLKFTLRLCGMQSRHTPTDFVSREHFFFFFFSFHPPSCECAGQRPETTAADSSVP